MYTLIQLQNMGFSCLSSYSKSSSCIFMYINSAVNWNVRLFLLVLACWVLTENLKITSKVYSLPIDEIEQAT